MTPLISVGGLITVLVIEGLPGLKQAGNYPPSEAALGCKGRCFLQGRRWPPRSSPVLGVVARVPQTLGGTPPSGGSRGAQGAAGREGLGRGGQAVFLQVCLWRCRLGTLLPVIALARWGSGANFISLVSAAIALREAVLRKGRAAWGRAGAVARSFSRESQGAPRFWRLFPVPTSTAER